MKISVAVALIFAAMFSISSCNKDDENISSSAPDGNSVLISRSCNPLVFPPQAHMYGHSYGVWSGKWWKWGLEMPLVVNHPFYDNPGFDVTMGQTGNVWFLAAPFGTVTRTCTIPAGKALMVALLAAEASDLEGYGNTYAALLAGAKSQADLIANVTCSVDGIDVGNINSYRVTSPAPPVTFTAPSPWYFGDIGGPGITVSDGYFVMVKPFSAGTTHVIHFSGDIPSYGLSLDMTYTITVQ